MLRLAVYLSVLAVLPWEMMKAFAESTLQLQWRLLSPEGSEARLA